jgi:hypothetical protein
MERQAMRLQVEEKALQKEKDKASKERLHEIAGELAALQEKLRPLQLKYKKACRPACRPALPQHSPSTAPAQPSAAQRASQSSAQCTASSGLAGVLGKQRMPCRAALGQLRASSPVPGP